MATQAAVAELLTTLGRLREGARANKEPLALHPATHLAGLSLWEVIGFLERLPGVEASGHLGSIRALLAAVADLESGTPSPMLKRADGKSPMPTELQLLMAKAAVALDALIRTGTHPDVAARNVGRELKQAGLRLPKQYTASLADTVKGWRNRLTTGAGAPPLAVKAWRGYMQLLSAGRVAEEEVDPASIPEILADLRSYVADNPFLSPP